MSVPKAAKWFEELSAQTPAAHAAHLVLEQRLRPVPKLLRLSAKRYAEDVEYVHQLRVATRRSGAALTAFRAFCPETLWNDVSEQLRKLRRAAGDARRDDVHYTILRADRAQAPEVLTDAFDHVLMAVAASRRRAQRAIRKAARRYRPRALKKARRKLLRGVAAFEAASSRSSDVADPPPDATLRPTATLGELAGRQLPEFLNGVRDAGAEDLSRLENVHQLRIACKKLRYALELFAAGFPPRLKEELYPKVEALQERLGELNDVREIAGRLEELLAVAQGKLDRAGERQRAKRAARIAGLEQLHAQYRDRLALLHSAFVRDWSGPGAHDFLDELSGLIAAGPVAPSEAPPAAPDPAPGASTGPDRPTATAGQRRPRVAEHVRVAAIDIGTNSIRLVIAETDRHDRFRIIEDFKETTRLGSNLYKTGRLCAEAVSRSLDALGRMKRIAEEHGVERIRAVGTSAVREATNGAAFIAAVEHNLGIPVEAIDADHEGRLAFASVASAFDLDEQRVAVVDIGGGSTEVVFSEEGVLDSIHKLPAGAVRLTEAYMNAGTPEDGGYERMQQAVDKIIRDIIGQPPAAPELIIGTGGTFTNLARISLLNGLSKGGGGRLPFNLRGYELPHSEVKSLLDALRAMTLEQRRQVRGLSSKRAEIIVAGLCIVERLMDGLGVPRVRVHDGGIRDGLLAEMIDELGFDPEPSGPNGARTLRVVRAFARQCNYEKDHSEHVAHLALQIFDQLAAVAPESAVVWTHPEVRHLLHAAAVLHDIGILISYGRHHKHSYDLIVKSRLPVFTRRELEIVANVARYHRKGGPSEKHANFRKLSDDDQRLVAHLAGILRIADGLDRLHTQNVRAVSVRVRQRRARFEVRADEEPHVNIIYARRKADVFEQAFGLKASFQWSDAGADASRQLERVTA